jgi:hypothetical protein
LRVLDTVTFHAYVAFLAKEVTEVIRADGDRDALERLHVEMNGFRARFNASQVPDELKHRFLDLCDAYHRTLAQDVSVTFIDSVITFISGIWFREASKRKRIEALKGLKTDLEALAMHTKLNY